MDSYSDSSRMEFEGLPVYMSRPALAFSISAKLPLNEILVIMEDGIDCARSRRKRGIIERCATYGGKWIKVVAQHTVHRKYGEECWLILHLDETERP